jgi:hypothetical protein
MRPKERAILRHKVRYFEHMLWKKAPRTYIGSRYFNLLVFCFSEPVIRRFLETQHAKLQGVILTGMGHVTDTLLISTLPKLKVSHVMIPLP